MNPFNVSQSTSSAEPSAFQSAQSALARKPLPGPRWAWPCVAALAVAGVAYLVAGTSGEHTTHRAALTPSAESTPPEGSSPAPTTAAATEPTRSTAAPASPAAPAPANDTATAAANGNAAAPAGENAAAPAQAEATPAKPSDGSEQKVASAAPVSKKKARGARNRSNRKRSSQTP